MHPNNLKSSFKLKQTSNPTVLKPGNLFNDKENHSNEVFYMNPLLIENLSQEELRTHAIHYEYKLLLLYGHDIGVYVVPQLTNINVWNCVIFIRAGLYKDAKFKFTMEFLKDFPKTRPVVRFLQPIYHPLINPKNNILDMNYLFPNWKYGSHLIFTILSEIKNIFTDISYLQVTNTLNPEGNPEAALKFGENIDEFYNRVTEDVEFSKGFLFDNPENSSLKFKEFNSEHEKLKTKLEEITKDDCPWEEKKRIFMSFILEGKETDKNDSSDTKKDHKN